MAPFPFYRDHLKFLAHDTLRNMKSLLLFLLFFTTRVYADLSYEFSYSLDSEDSYLKKIMVIAEENSALSIRFGVNRNIEILTDHWEEPKNCERITAEDIFKTVGDTIFINEQLISSLKRENIYSSKCFWPKKIGEAFQEALLKLPFANDLAAKYTKKDRFHLLDCKRLDEEIRTGTKPFEKLNLECQQAIGLDEKKEAYKHYLEKIKSITYNLNLKIDLTSFGDQTLDRYEMCRDLSNPTHITSEGNIVKMIGMSIVYMSPGFATSVMGHAGERYLFCYNHELIDKFFDYTKFNNAELPDLFSRHDKKKISETYLKSLNEKIYIKERYNPATASVYGNYQARHNREILEVWLNTSNEKMFLALNQATDDYNEQSDRIEHSKELTPYLLLKNNCTHPIKKRLELIDPQNVPEGLSGLTPRFILSFLKSKKHKMIVHYPSQRTFRLLKIADDGKSLLKEHFKSLSIASRGASVSSSVIIYPETQNIIKSFFVFPAAGLINFGSALIHGNGRDAALSILEIFGIRTRYPSATPWLPNEEDFLFDITPLLVPEVVSL